MTYENTCNICKKEGKETIYVGETYRSLAERHSEHVSDWIDNKEESHMNKHALEAHSGITDFSIKIVKSHKTAISRQISETVRIKCKTLEGATLLNSKTEYNRCLLPELTVERGQDKTSEEDRSKGSQGEFFFKAGRKIEDDSNKEGKRTAIDQAPDSKKRRRTVQEPATKRKPASQSSSGLPTPPPKVDIKIRGLVPLQKPNKNQKIQNNKKTNIINKINIKNHSISQSQETRTAKTEVQTKITYKPAQKIEHLTTVVEEPDNVTNVNIEGLSKPGEEQCAMPNDTERPVPASVYKPERPVDERPVPVSVYKTERPVDEQNERPVDEQNERPVDDDERPVPVPVYKTERPVDEQNEVLMTNVSSEELSRPADEQSAKTDDTQQPVSVHKTEQPVDEQNEVLMNEIRPVDEPSGVSVVQDVEQRTTQRPVPAQDGTIIECKGARWGLGPRPGPGIKNNSKDKDTDSCSMKDSEVKPKEMRRKMFPLGTYGPPKKEVPSGKSPQGKQKPKFKLTNKFKNKTSNLPVLTNQMNINKFLIKDILIKDKSNQSSVIPKEVCPSIGQTTRSDSNRDIPRQMPMGQSVRTELTSDRLPQEGKNPILPISPNNHLILPVSRHEIRPLRETPTVDVGTEQKDEMILNDYQNINKYIKPNPSPGVDQETTKEVKETAKEEKEKRPTKEERSREIKKRITAIKKKHKISRDQSSIKEYIVSQLVSESSVGVGVGVPNNISFNLGQTNKYNKKETTETPPKFSQTYINFKTIEKGGNPEQQIWREFRQGISRTRRQNSVEKSVDLRPYDNKECPEEEYRQTRNQEHNPVTNSLVNYSKDLDKNSK